MPPGKIGGDLYSLEIIGFRLAGVDVSEFWTTESQLNRAGLLGRVSLRSDIPTTVPEPATVGLLLTGLALGRAARRRRPRA